MNVLLSLEGMAIPHCPIRMDLRGCAMSPKNYTESKSGIVWLAPMAVATKKFRVLIWGLECMLNVIYFPFNTNHNLEEIITKQKKQHVVSSAMTRWLNFSRPFSIIVEKGLAKGDCSVIPNRALLFLGGYVGGLVVGPWDFDPHLSRTQPRQLWSKAP